tara:strand:- start:56817 stop:58016 length:1200 start_codon:yes stop_codon:yes gene_type:complete
MTEVLVPTLPESISDATVLTWHKKTGDSIKRDETLIELETDKVVLEVPSPVDGILTKINAEIGAIVSTDDVLAEIDSTGKLNLTDDHNMNEVKEKSQLAHNDNDIVLTPAVRRLIKELEIDPSKISGTGKDGRILKSDVMQYLDENGKEVDAIDIKATISKTDSSEKRNIKRVPMSRLRARISERLLDAQRNAAILTTFNEVNLERIVETRRKYKNDFQEKYGVRLGFMSFFIKAVISALKNYPIINASLDKEDIIYHNYFDIGVAVSSPRGLVVPVIKDADNLSFAEIERCIKNFGEKAKEGNLDFDELTGGTFTISNGGVFGSMLSTPILNPPQSAILGMHSIDKRPIVLNDEIVIRPMMYLALSYDHRIIDGREAVQALSDIKRTLEDPTCLLFSI